jgi:GntR family transcriptional regulator / MocR family aminotransferase
VVPPSLLEAVTHAKLLADQGSARIDQFAFADFLTRGELDRHLRRMRARYRARRDAMVAALADALPEATVRGVAAGLHAIVELPAGDDEQAIRDEARRRGIALAILDSYRIDPRDRPPTLLLGYGQVSEPAIRAGIAELAAAVRAARSKPS